MAFSTAVVAVVVTLIQSLEFIQPIDFVPSGILTYVALIFLVASLVCGVCQSNIELGWGLLAIAWFLWTFSFVFEFYEFYRSICDACTYWQYEWRSQYPGKIVTYFVLPTLGSLPVIALLCRTDRQTPNSTNCWFLTAVIIAFVDTIVLWMAAGVVYLTKIGEARLPDWTTLF